MSSTLLSWIFTIVFIAVLASGFLIGMWRGLKRSTFNLILSIVGVLVAFFVTPAITKAVLNISVNVDGKASTLQNVIVDLFRSDKDINAMMLANKNLEAFFLNLPSALVNVVLFILVTLAVQGVLYALYKVLAVTCFKIKEDEKKHKLLGGVVGLAKTLLVGLFALMPLAGLTGVANNLMTSDDYGIVYTTEAEVERTSFAEDKLPKGTKNIVQGLENNLPIKMCGVFGLDNAMFDYYSSFKIEDETLYIRKEADNLFKVVDFTYQITKVDLGKVNYLQVRYDKLLKAIEETTNSTLFKKVVSETLADFVINYEDYSFIADSSLVKEYKEVIDKIGAHLNQFAEAGETFKYFQNDLLKAVNAFKMLGQSGIINDVLDIENKSIEKIASTITNTENQTAFKNALDDILDVNIVRDAIVEIAQKGLDMISSDLEKIGTTATDWTEEDWDNFTTSIYNIVNDFGDIAGEVDIFKVIKDATILLDQEKNYDINLISGKLGSMIDEIRANKLLKTSENKSVVDKFLEDNNVKLPENQVKEHNGDYMITIDSWTDYFNFIKNSLIKLRDKGVYKLVNDSTLTTKNKISNLASILSEEGNEGLLSDIILPLYQVEPTKTMIIDKLSNSLQSDFIDFSKLSTYEEWESDLEYLSDMLVIMNDLSDGTNSFLSLALDGKIDEIIDNLTEAQVDSVLKPVLYAKSTTSVKEQIFTNIKSQIDSATGGDCSLSISGVTMKEGDALDQVSEICETLKHLLKVDKALDGGATLKTVDKLTLGNLLNTMRDNAYREELLNKQEVGVFKNAFISLVNKFKSEYQTEVNYIQTQPQILAELGVENLNEENYKNINYIQLLNKIAEFENA